MSSSTPRERILAAAVAILHDEGAAALTVRNVANGAGCSTTGVYTHFGGKQGLVDALFVEGFESLDAAMATAGPDLIDAARRYRSWALAHRTHYLVMFGHAVPDHEPSPEALARAEASFDGLELCVGALGLDPVRSGSLAYHVWAVMHGYVMLDLLGMHPPELGSPAELYDAGIALLAVSVGNETAGLVEPGSPIEA